MQKGVPGHPFQIQLCRGVYAVARLTEHSLDGSIYATRSAAQQDGIHKRGVITGIDRLVGKIRRRSRDKAKKAAVEARKTRSKAVQP